MSEEDYLRHELQSEVRHEYLNGKLLAMSGESALNNLIALRVASLLMQRLTGSDYFVFIEGVKVKVPGESKYFYPDIFVTNEPLTHPEFVKHRPQLIAEVLSESTRKYDTIDKFIQYQKFDSLKYYLLIEPAITLVSLFIRTGADWELSTFTGINDMIDLPAIGVSFNLSEIYK